MLAFSQKGRSFTSDECRRAAELAETVAGDESAGSVDPYRLKILTLKYGLSFSAGSIRKSWWDFIGS